MDASEFKKMIFDKYKFRRILDFLKIKKPLIIFDLETTGPAISEDKIIHIAYIKIMPNSRIIRDNFFLNPEMKVSKESMAVHGITNKDLTNKRTFKEKAHEIWGIFSGCYYGGFDIMSFDLPVLRREFIRVGMSFEYSEKDIIDSKTIFNYMEPRTLSVAYKYYCNKEHFDIYNAVSDVDVAIDILEKQLQKYKMIRDWEFIGEIHSPQQANFIDHKNKFYWRDGEPYLNFSKYRDTSLIELVKIAPNFLNWILKADFSEETKNIIRKALGKPQKNKKKNYKISV